MYEERRLLKFGLFWWYMMVQAKALTQFQETLKKNQTQVMKSEETETDKAEETQVLVTDDHCQGGGGGGISHQQGSPQLCPSEEPSKSSRQ